jgi:GntR family transcriptional regulator/MocR family aminotransferase
MRELYAERLGVLLDGARERLAASLEISNVEAGLQTVGWLNKGLNSERVAAAADREGIEVIPLSRYAYGRAKRDGLILGFAAVEPRELRRGIEKLAKVLNG